MREKEDKIYVFSDVEIKVLLTGLGYENIVGILPDEKNDNPQYSEIINIILKMVNQGIIGFNHGRMFVESEAAELLCCIGSGENSFSVTFPMSDKTICYYFSGDCAVKCEPMVYQQGKFMVSSISESEFFEEILQHEDLKALLKNEDDISEKNLWKDDLNTVAFIDVFKGTYHYAEINIRSHAFGKSEMVINYINGSESNMNYSKENFVCLLNSIIQSE